MGLKEMTMGKFPWDLRCKLCGQYILEGEDTYIVYPPSNDKSITFGIVHSQELDAISEGLTENEKLEKLRGKRTPGFKGFTEEQKANAKIFEDVCCKRGYRTVTMSKRTLKVGRRGTSFKFTYDMITGKIGSDYRGRTGLLDGLFIMQFESEVQHEMEKLQGKEPCKIITVNSVIKQAVDETNKLMGIKG